MAHSRIGPVSPWRWFVLAVSSRLSFIDTDAIREATFAEQGISHVATWLIADHLREGRLLRILPDTRTRGFPIHAIWPRWKHIAPKVRVLIDELVRNFFLGPRGSKPTESDLYLRRTRALG